jgi:hypothetical protein
MATDAGIDCVTQLGGNCLKARISVALKNVVRQLIRRDKCCSVTLHDAMRFDYICKYQRGVGVP